MSKANAARALTLREFLVTANAPFEVRLDIARRLLTAVARMHERDRVHGRLAPDTVRLTGVRSFRVEVSLDDDEPRSGARDTRYAPPEGEPSMRGDVFALGTILGELFGEDPPPQIAPLLAIMTQREPIARYASAQVAMNAFARAR